MNAWLNPGDEAAVETSDPSPLDEVAAPAAPVAQSAPAPKSGGKSPSAVAAQSNTDDLTKAFDNLFNS